MYIQTYAQEGHWVGNILQKEPAEHAKWQEVTKDDHKYISEL